jgi:nitrogen fixation NifU-like protein
VNSDLRRSIILDNYENPINRGRCDDCEGYIKKNSRNVSCIDNIDLYIKIKNNVIEDLKFDGEACVISISSSSIMSNTLIGKTVDEALDIINNYQNMIEEKEYDRDKLEEAIVYDDVYKQPSRKKCATLSWNGIEKVLLEYKNK